MVEKRKYNDLKHGEFFLPEELDNIDFPDIPPHIKLLNPQVMWEKGITGEGVKVAIIDSGCDINNPLLKGKISHICNLTRDDDGDRANVTDYSGHGTHVASIIASDNYNDLVVGIAPNVKLMIYKVIEKDGQARYENIARAIYAAIQSGADILNISLGGSQEAPQIHEAIKSAIKMNVCVVVAAGNGGNGESDLSGLWFPSCYPESIQVGSIGSNKKASKFTTTNHFTDCVAVGEKVLGLSQEGGFEVLNGTSQAAPIVSASLALLKEWAKKEFKRDPSESELYSLLIKNTKTIKGVSRNAQGKGYVVFNKNTL
ncbi:S8 family peptidase [Peptostreptococcus faecalis]|uniref:S8 family peptidase n=1 Tax=Peptostreptococcus faecalis TaxID=2045015 RepID=UPI000C7C14C2|nr:S8 family serine peptidase [Peptostreptococcus faecalis]